MKLHNTETSCHLLPPPAPPPDTSRHPHTVATLHTVGVTHVLPLSLCQFSNEINNSIKGHAEAVDDASGGLPHKDFGPHRSTTGSQLSSLPLLKTMCTQIGALYGAAVRLTSKISFILFKCVARNMCTH